MNHKAECVIHFETGDAVVKGYFNDDKGIFVRTDFRVENWVVPQFSGNKWEDKQNTLYCSLRSYLDWIGMLICCAIGTVPNERIETLMAKAKEAQERYLKLREAIKNGKDYVEIQ